MMYNYIHQYIDFLKMIKEEIRMKQMLKTGKKALSVFMAVMMVLTAWVWVAPTEAEAATAGNYKVRITWQVNNTKNYNNSFTGTETEDGARAGIILYYKSNNGSGTQSSMYWCLDSTNYGGTYVSAEKSTGNTNSSTGKNYYCVATIAGFPTALYGMADSDYFGDKGQYTVSKIEVYNNTTSAYTTLWAGKGYTDTSTEKKWWKITADGDGTVTTTGNDSSYGYASTTTETWNFPTPTTATTWSSVSAMTIPKTGTATQNIEIVVNDQYGVEMFNPTWSVKGSVCGTTGISVDPATSSQTTTIKLTNSANVSSTTDTQTGTITATWSTLGSLSETFTMTDSYYTATFNYKSSAGADTSTKKNGYHGDTITAPSAPEYDLGDYHYVFSKWSPTFASTITKDITYTAQYTSAFVGADYTAVNNAIAAANGIKTNHGTEYELKYTHASRLALDSAINAVVTGLGRTQQSTVDGYAQAINDAIAGLDPNKFDVIFLDKDGAILLYEKDVEYKEAVTAPTYSATYYDSTNHYTFTGWDTNEYTSVVDDLVIQPVFTAEAHSFTTSTVPSTCVTKGATKYTCSCGYSYIDGETDYGDHVWATGYTVDLEPTCTVAGSKSIHCTLCDAQKDITAIDPLGHQWSSQSVAVEASCGKIGIMTKVCDDCGVCEHTIIPALEHDYAENTVAPTCTTKGYTEYTCQRADCGHSYRDNYTDVIAHTYGAWETVSEAHCGVAGVKKQTCTECGHVNIGSIDALTHDELDSLTWNIIVEDTCEYAGYRTKTCSKCNNVIAAESFNDITDHDYETATTPATCTQAGYTVTTCKRACGYEKTTVLQPLGHKYENADAIEDVAATCTTPAYKIYKCDTCGETKTVYVAGSTALLHDFTGTETIIKNADCENDGEKTVECSRCDVTTNVIIPKLGHKYGEWDKTTNPATNDKDGKWTRTCTKCNDVEELTIPKGGHVWDNGTQTLAPTCTTTGTMVYKCITHTDCGVTLEAVIPVTQHNVVQEETAATCTKTGSVKAYCEVCGLDLSTEEIPVKAHDFVAQTPVASTCTTSGYTPYTCACGATYNAYNENDPAKGHDFSVFVLKNDATCTADGEELYKCSRCDAEQTTVLPKTGHSYVKGTVVNADCVTAGTEVYTCACGDTYTKFIEAAKGHSWSESWTVVREATDDKHGVEKTTCIVCGEEKFRTTEPIGDHKFNVVTVDATCTQPGLKTYTCSVHTDCSANYTEEIPATGHTGKLAYTAPTCTTAGSTQIICSVCSGEISDKQIIPAAGHTYDEGVVTLEAGCATTGTKTYTCSCGDSYTETIPAKGHELTTVVNDATCDKAGSVVITCANCNDPAVEKTVELAAKGHIWKDTYESKIDATCETDGSETYKCQFCEATNVVVIPKLGHNWGEWNVTKASTNTEKGVLTRTCLRGCTETAEIPAGGHELVIDAEKSIDASCSAEGTLVYKCNNHADCGITVSVSVPKTQHTVAQRESLATCTKTGSVEAYCTVCGKVLSTEEIPVKAHEYKAGTPVAATCTTSGYTPYTCSCGASYNKYNADENATGHNYVKVENSSTATCTAEGTITLKCSVCNNEINVDVPALGHDYAEDEAAATEATCAAAATKTYKCSRCDASYTISVGDKTDSHSFNDWVTVEEASEVSLGYQTRTCSLCGKLEVETLEAAGEHQFETGDITESKAATCTENGYEIRKCTVHEDCGKTATIVIPATGHDEVVNTVDATCEGEGTVITTCKNCDYKVVEAIAELGHLYEAGSGKITPATCNAEGKIEYTCTRCNGETKTVIIPVDADAHNYKTTVKQATCVADGSVVTECLICGVKTTEIIPATGHSWNSGSVSKKATCEEAGLRKLTCLKCAATSDEVIPALGHTYEAGKTVAPTCTTSGYTVYTCKNDENHKYNVYDETKPATGHTWSDWTIDINATETTEGLKIRTCTCGETDEQVIPAMMHEMTEIENVPSTCSQAGHITYKCKIDHEGVKCSYTLTVDLPLVAHALKTTVTEASCKVAGSVLTECTVCDYETTEALALKPHKLTVTTTAATCEGEGSVVEKCEVCGETNTTTIAALGHDFSGKETIVTPASCSDDGKKTIGCTRCDAVKEIIIPQTAHNFEPKEVVAATCTTSGYTVNRCACGREYNVLDSDPIGHSWNKGEITKDATCTTDGEKTFTCTRDNCGATRTEVISKFGHSWGAWEVVVNPTATVDGLQMRKCLRGCGVTDSVVIPALGGTTTYTVTFVADGKVIATQTVVHGGSATAPEIGNKAPDANGHYSFIWDTDFTKVTEDLTVTAVYTQAAHNYGEWITDIEATCKAQGKQHRVCADCSYIQTQTVAVKSHDYSVVKSEKEATCTESGYTVRACSYCGTTTTETTMRLGHTMTYHEYIPETCDTDGSMAYYSCSRCGKSFADRLGKTELTDIVISKKYHTFIVSEGKDPTCTAEGVTDYLYCTSCGFTQNPSSIPALGHVDANKDNACDRCGGTYMEGGQIVCTCNCHKSGIFNELIYKILLFFWRLFGMNKSCACGRVHY